MSKAAGVVLKRLNGLGFRVQPGAVSPFSETLPLVVGSAWDERTLQIVLVAEAEPGSDGADPWRQLMFAASGLQHHLSEGATPAFGPPLVLALVDDPGERVLRSLAEDLAEDYALFRRVDLNFVRLRDVGDPDALDLALAPLLPRCRAALSSQATIAREDVRSFWDTLRDRVRQAATKELDSVFDPFASAIAENVADALIGSIPDEEERPAPVPVKWLELENFRSFDRASIELTSATVLYGNNGSGKTTILEALELLWSRGTQRRPPRVPPAEYARHLPREGEGKITIRGEASDHARFGDVSDVAERAEAELVRCVLTQDKVGNLANAEPGDRYIELGTVTGLEIPELDPRTEQILREAKAEADDALREHGFPPIPAANRDGLEHVRRLLTGDFSNRMPPLDELADAERALAIAAGGAYEARDWADHAQGVEALMQVDRALETVREELGGAAELAERLDEAAGLLRKLGAARQEATTTARSVLDSLVERDVAAPTVPAPAGPIPPALAARWAAHAKGLREAADTFRSAAGEVDEPSWATRLRKYADGVEAAAELAPVDELASLARQPALDAREPPTTTVRPDLYRAAGFVGVPDRPPDLRIPLRELHDHLQQQSDALDALAAELDRHPARGFTQPPTRLLRALCRFELARIVRRRGPIARASETVLSEILQTKLQPLVRELVTAIVRFEWYFKQLEMQIEGKRMLIGGLATARRDLDIRLLLNSAERTVVGVAWFLALHLLQPQERRRVLILDDPMGGFDPVNQAGFVATLRAFARLSRPEQLIVTTHDDAIAATLETEFAPVAGWPEATSRMRCRRNAADASVVEVETSVLKPADLGRELGGLGFEEETALSQA